jgi:small subunit ribosomal protein S8e
MMPNWHGDLHKKKKTGGRITPQRGKKAFEKGSPPTETKINKKKLRVIGSRGRTFKFKLLSDVNINVLDPSTGKTRKGELKKVLENTSNRDFQKRQIITKGAIVDTTIGKVKVTSRPGQEGVVNGILLKKN